MAFPNLVPCMERGCFITSVLIHGCSVEFLTADTLKPLSLKHTGYIYKMLGHANASALCIHNYVIEFEKSYSQLIMQIFEWCHYMFLSGRASESDHEDGDVEPGCTTDCEAVLKPNELKMLDVYTANLFLATISSHLLMRRILRRLLWHVENLFFHPCQSGDTPVFLKLTV